MNDNYILFGPEWKAEMMKWNKKDLVDKLAKELEHVRHLTEIADYRNECRHYLMANDPKDITIEGTLEKLGFGRNGLRL